MADIVKFFVWIYFLLIYTYLAFDSSLVIIQQQYHQLMFYQLHPAVHENFHLLLMFSDKKNFSFFCCCCCCILLFDNAQSICLICISVEQCAKNKLIVLLYVRMFIRENQDVQNTSFEHKRIISMDVSFFCIDIYFFLLLVIRFCFSFVPSFTLFLFPFIDNI